MKTQGKLKITRNNVKWRYADNDVMHAMITRNMELDVICYVRLFLHNNRFGISSF